MTGEAMDTDELPPVRYLIMEVLAARYRTGETTWTFPARFRRSLDALAGLGLIGCKSGVAPRTYIAWLTDAGKASAPSDTYVPPDAVGRCGDAAPIIIHAHTLRPICALLAGHPGWHRADDGCEWGIANEAQP